MSRKNSTFQRHVRTLTLNAISPDKLQHLLNLPGKVKYSIVGCLLAYFVLFVVIATTMTVFAAIIARY
ncbi:hypothetical protein [Leptolyngbya sp. 7M]|uniref:hypothetical protein n=1 Tax=Leptolyngbya sp. 7M TaxID=2812896 RepID=UPI001B8AC7DA|nr:hypothetical protein [Leptolyngbya sp. 7M]QYO63154.1 hypothetical protein JVX88_24810 [Leptolyngbya sp. 7M]